MMIGQVAHFAALLDKDRGRVVGYAAPVGEVAPCTIHLRNGRHLMAAARAIYFAPEALHLRAGWCGFSLGVDQRMFIFDDNLDLCCASSGRILMTISFADGEGGWAGASQQQGYASVTDLLSSVAARPSVPGFAHLMERVVERQGASVAADALYHMLLRRPADPGGLAQKAGQFGSLDGIVAAIEEMLRSEEYASLPVTERLSSPFDYGSPPEAILALID